MEPGLMARGTLNSFDSSARPSRPSCVQAEGWEAKMGWGYELLGLEAHELIWEHSLDTKALLGWGAGGITIAFRGTASLRNALSDLQVKPNAAALSFTQTIASPLCTHLVGLLRFLSSGEDHLQVVQLNSHH